MASMTRSAPMMKPSRKLPYDYYHNNVYLYTRYCFMKI